MKNPKAMKSFNCGICGGICSQVRYSECNELTCIFHRIIKNGFICNKYKKDDENVRLLFR